MVVMSAASLLSSIIGMVFKIVKFTIISVFKVGRWVWDKAHLR